MDNNGNRPKKSLMRWLIIIFLGFLSFLIIGISLFWMKYGAVFGPIFFTPQWRKDFDAASEKWRDDRAEGDRLIRKAIKDAETSGASPLEKMGLHRDYANLLYNNGEYSRGHEEISASIAACPKDPGPLEADALSHAYQDRGWEMHREHIEDAADPSGVEDQEKSVAVCEKAFGPSSQQTIDKVSSLAAIYSELNLKDKAKKALDRALDASDHVKACQACGWYAYAMQARIQAGDRRYQEAMKAYLHACSLAANKEEKDRIWDEFVNGLKFSQPKVAPELKDLDSLLAKGKYQELDVLAAALRKTGKEQADGYWLLDKMYETLAGADRNEKGKWQSGDTFEQRIFDLEKWMKSAPQSATARVALADIYIEYAWFARGNGYSDTVSEKGWRLFHERAKKGREILDKDSEIFKKDPRAYLVYSRIARAESMDKGEFLKQVEECHKDWPGYTTEDFGASLYLLPRWGGEQYETENYILKRAASIGGVKGDIARSRMTLYVWRYLDDLFSAESPLKWPEVKRGFALIFKQYPDDTDIRVKYMKLARAAGDEQAFEKVFESK